MLRPLLIFDIDGTLLETTRVTLPAVNRLMGEYGLPEPGAAKVQSFFGRPAEDFEQWIRSQSPPGEETQFVERMKTLELEHIGSTGRLFAGVMEFLTAFHKRAWPMAICSNGHKHYVETVLDSHKLRPFFDLIRYRGTKYASKAEMVGEILGLIAHQGAIVIGDREDDVSSAHDHGIMALGAAYGYGSPVELSRADAQVAHARDIPSAVDSLLNSRGPKAG